MYMYMYIMGPKVEEGHFPVNTFDQMLTFVSLSFCHFVQEVNELSYLRISSWIPNFIYFLYKMVESRVIEDKKIEMSFFRSLIYIYIYIHIIDSTLLSLPQHLTVTTSLTCFIVYFRH